MKNPRITVTLQPGAHALLQRASELAGTSVSALIGSLLEESAPIFDRMVQVLEAAHVAKDSLRNEFSDSLDEAQSRIEGQLGLALAAFEDGSRPILEEAERIRRRKGAPRAGKKPASKARPTPMSNRGVTSPGKTLRRSPKRGPSSK